MGDEKDILKFDGDISKYETWSMKIYAHAIKSKFEEGFRNEKHPELSINGTCAAKSSDKSKAKRIKRLLKMNNRAVANI